MKDIPIINGIKDYVGEGIVPFSMPGHKMGRAFSNFNNILITGDLTEVDGLDNLHKPEGIIKEAEDRLSSLYNSEKSYLLVNGSTCGNLIMIFSSFNEGDKVLVERNCHRSIMNGIIMRKLEPIFIKNIFNNKLKAPIGIDIDHLENTLKEYTDIKGIILTYPNYYGIGIGLEYIINLCKDNGLKVLVDSAHGAHFGFNDKLPESVQQLKPDMVVMSAHKTLPSLTQTAWLHINNGAYLDRVEFYKGIFMSTSPSYMFMMSLDYSRSYLEHKAKNDYDKLFDLINEFKNKVKKLNYITIVDKKFLKNPILEQVANNKYKIDIDESRIVINLSEGFNGNKLLEYLRENKIQCEMSEHKNVVLIPSTFNIKEDFEILTDVLLKCDKEILKENEVNFYITDIPKMGMLPYKVIDRAKEVVNLGSSIGSIVGENIIPYPPGVPILIAGEVIEEEHVNVIKTCVKNNITVIGIDNNKIKVIKN